MDKKIGRNVSRRSKAPPPIPPRPKYLIPVHNNTSSMPDIIKGAEVRQADYSKRKQNEREYSDNRKRKDEFYYSRREHDVSSRGCGNNRSRNNNNNNNNHKISTWLSFTTSSNNKHERRTNWYVENPNMPVVGNSPSSENYEASLIDYSPRSREAINSDLFYHRRYYYPSMASLSGLPPLPKSLAEFTAPTVDKKEHVRPPPVHPKFPPPPPPSSDKSVAPVHFKGHPSTAPPPPPPRKPTSLDVKLAILRKEMYELRQMDLSLLTQLWSLNESIHDFRQMHESLYSEAPSSDEDDESIYSNIDSNDFNNDQRTYNMYNTRSPKNKSTSESFFVSDL